MRVLRSQELAADAAGPPAGRVPAGDVLEREQLVAVDERRRRLRDAVDRTAVRIEQDRRAGWRRRPSFDFAKERVDAGARKRGSDVVRLRREGRPAYPVAEARVQRLRAARPEEHRVEVGQRTEVEGTGVAPAARTARGAPGAGRTSRRTGRSSRHVSHRSPSPRQRAARRARPVRSAPSAARHRRPAPHRPGPSGPEGCHRAHGVGREREPRGDPEIAATAATARPEQVRVSLRVALPDDPVRGHHREAPEVVAGEAELATANPTPPPRTRPAMPTEDTTLRELSRPGPRARGRHPSAAPGADPYRP